MVSAELQLGPLDYIICLITVGVSVSLGIYFAIRAKRQTSVQQYFIGSRQMSVIPVGISMAVSYMSSGVMVGNPAEAYHYGIPFLFSCWSVAIANFLSAWICAPLWYQLKITSSYQYLDLRYKSRLLRMVCAGLGVLQSVSTQVISHVTFNPGDKSCNYLPNKMAAFLEIVDDMIYCGTVLFGSAAAVQAVTGFPSWGTICILGFSTILYTTIGGFTAVIWTDVFQLLVMVVGLMAICIKTFIDLGSMQDFWDNLVAGKRVQVPQFNPDPTIRTSFWSSVVGGVVQWFLMAFSQQGVQRVASMRNLTQAKKLFPYSTPVFVFLTTVTFFEGLAAYAYYAKKGCDPFVEGVISNVNGIMPYFVMELCGDLPGLLGLFMAAIFSASISTMSSCLNSISAVAVSDFVMPFWSTISNRTATWIAKSFVVVSGVISLGISFLTSSIGGPVTQITLVFLGAVLGPNSGVFLLGAFCPWVNVKGALAGVVSGLGITFWIAFSGFTVKIPRLPPAPSNRCWLNESFKTNSSDSFVVNSLSNLTLIDTTTTEFPVYTDLPYDGPGITKLYAISYMLYPMLGLLITALVGMVVSLLTGCSDPADINPMCISHLIRHKYYKPKPTEKELDLLVPPTQHRNSPKRNPQNEITS